MLRERGQRVEKFDDQLAKLSVDMLELMHLSDGIGLAAQQVGLALQFCVVEVPDHPDYPMDCILDGKPLSPSLIMPVSLANPVVKPLHGKEYFYEEGCLSFPGINADVARPERIVVTYQDLESTAAPAPSPNKTQVVLSSQSIMLDIFSAPTTRALR